MKIKTKIAAFLLAGCIGLSFPVCAAEYSDIYNDDTAFAVSVLDALGVVEGFPDGGYHPEQTLTRAQFCKMAVILMGMEDKAASASQRTLFSDVTSAHWAASYIYVAYENGIIEGYGNGQFGPDDTLTYAQVLTIMLRMLGYSDTDIGNRYPSDQMRVAENIGLTEQILPDADDTVSRGDTAQLFLTLLNTETKTGNPYYKTVAARSAENIILLDNSDTSSAGKSDCVKVYENGQAVWYRKSDEYAQGTVGAEGTALLDEDGRIFAFLPGETEYTLIDGILISSDSETATFLISGYTEELATAVTLSSSLVGYSGTVIINGDGEVSAFLGDEKYGSITENAVLIDNNCISDEGVRNCALFYVNGKKVWYEQTYHLKNSLVGCTGTLLCDEDGVILDFRADGHEYSVGYAMLIEASSSKAEFYLDGATFELRLADSIGSNAAGSYGYLLLNSSGKVEAFLEDDSAEVKYSISKQGILLDSCVIAADHRTETLKIYINGNIATYLVSDIDSDCEGLCGRLLLDENECAVDYLEDETYCAALTGDQVAEQYKVKDNATVVYYDAQNEEWSKTTWGSHKDKLTESDTVAIYFTSLGDIDVLVVR